MNNKQVGAIRAFSAHQRKKGIGWRWGATSKPDAFASAEVAPFVLKKGDQGDGCGLGSQNPLP